MSSEAPPSKSPSDDITDSREAQAAAQNAPAPAQENGKVAFDSVVEDGAQEDKNREYPSTPKLVAITIGLALGVFLYGLDQTILATAVPRITDDFGALNDVGWYASAYLFCSSAFQLLFGKLYTLFLVKAVYFCALGLFELGSLICATAPNSPALIVGRAIAGIGAAGLYSGSVVILSHSAPLAKRGLLTSLIGAALGIASVVGPFLGGAFTDSVTWRWCFYINLPLGFITFVLIMFFIKIPRDPRYMGLKPSQLLAQLDIPGIGVLIPSIICLLLALQWGGVQYPWNDGRIIALLVLAIAGLISFAIVEKLTPKTAAITSIIFRTRTTAFAAWYGGCFFAAFMIMVYYLPLWFQGVQQVSALESGERNIPLIIGFIIFAILSGGLTNAIGYYAPLMIIASIITSIGAGLLTTLNPSSSSGMWIGYQALFGFGIGFGIQHPLLAVQTVLPHREIPIGVTLITLLQSLFGAIFVSISQNVFQNQLFMNVRAIIPGFDANALIRAGATRLADFAPPEQLEVVLAAYSLSLTQTYYVTVAVACLSLLGALGTEWKSVKKEGNQGQKQDSREKKAGNSV